MIMSFLVTVIVPVYNGEKYLDKTLTSIKKQTYKNIEVLLVDDASTDKSPTILKEFAQADKRFYVFWKSHGGMVPKSMNFILPHIKGYYYFYTSQDDIFSEDLIENMVLKQKETNADTVLPDIEFYQENKIDNKKIIGLNSNRNVELTGNKALIESLNWNIHGFALFKSTLLRGEFFPEDAFDSDDYITRKLFLKSNKVVFSKGVFFYRQDNENAITKTFSAKNFYVLNTTKNLYNLLNENKMQKKYLLGMQEILLKSHLRFMSIQEFYCFNSEIQRKKIRDYLFGFKKNVLTDTFITQNISYALKTFKIKYIMVFFIYKFPPLIKLVSRIYSVYLKKKY